MQDEKKTELTGMTCEEITKWVREAGMPAFRGKQIFQWIHRGADFDGMSNLPKDLREKLAAWIEGMGGEYTLLDLRSAFGTAEDSYLEVLRDMIDKGEVPGYGK